MSNLHDIISPHFDDAALSCASVMLRSGPATRVITVCAGVPSASTAASDWDRRCGFTDARTTAITRRVEDVNACAVVGAEAVHLPFLERDHAAVESRAHWAAWLTSSIAPNSTLWLPAGIGGHVDHVGVREVLLSHIADHRGSVRLYADTPYACTQGWDTADEAREPQWRWQPYLAAWGAAGATLFGPNIVRLDAQQTSRKVSIVRCFASQICALGDQYPKLTDVEGDLSTEVWWELS